MTIRGVSRASREGCAGGSAVGPHPARAARSRVTVALALAFVALACTQGGPGPGDGTDGGGPTRSADELIAAITTADSGDERLDAAAELAALADADAVAMLAGLAESDQAAADGLTMVRDAVIALYGDERSAEDPARRTLLVAVLAEIDDETSAGALVGVLAEDPDDGVALAAAEALRAMTALSSVVSMLVDARSEIAAGSRATALEELVVATGDAGMAAMITALGEQPWVERALAEFGTDVVEPVARAIEDRNPSVELAAVRTLAAVEQAYPGAAADIWPSLVDRSIDKLGGPGEGHAQALLIAIGGPALAPLFEATVTQVADPAARANLRAMSAGLTIEQMASENPRPLIAFMKQKLAKPDYPFLRRFASYFIRFGKPGSESILIDALNGTSSLVDSPVLDFLESGHRPLEQAARAWASRHGYTITGQPAGFLSWGDWGIF